MQLCKAAALLAGALVSTFASHCKAESPPQLFPANGAEEVNPDTRLLLTFPSPPKIGKSGVIEIYDTVLEKVVDRLDLSIPVSPNPSGRAKDGKAPKYADPNDRTVYQNNTIAGVKFHFFPIIVRNTTAAVTLHNGALSFGRKYRVLMDAAVLEGVKFGGFTGDTWTFCTRLQPPAKDVTRYVVAADGSGDFNSIQGAIDFLPDKVSTRRTIYIKNGDYEELVFIKGYEKITLRGESRDKVKVGYPNNSAFNPSRSNGPSLRVAFTLYKCTDIQLTGFTINNYYVGQAEALLIDGERIIIDNMDLNGSGDAFTTYGTIYFVNSKLTGHGDTVLGYGAVYFLNATIESIGPFTWTRTRPTNHGNILVNSTLIGVDAPLPWTTAKSGKAQKPKAVFARLPRNEGSTTGLTNFANAEMVLINCRTQNVAPEGFGPIESEASFDRSQVRFWEHNTMDMEGKPVDVSQRHPIVKQLVKGEDGMIIMQYQNPAFVLNGWNPVIDTT